MPAIDRDHEHPERLNADGLGDRAQEARRQVDAEMVEDVAELAAQQVEAFGEAGELLAGDDPGGEAAGDVEHAERRDEGRQAEADREQRVDQPRPACRPACPS